MDCAPSDEGRGAAQLVSGADPELDGEPEVLVVFGAGRLPEIGGALGKSIKNFKRATEGKDEIEINPKNG